MAMDPTTGMSRDEKIVLEAKERYRQAEQWESQARQNFLYDMRFCNGDSSNGFMWPNEVMMARASENRPCLTVNKTKQHCLQIINDQRQNQSQIEIRPVGDGATYEAARIYEGICRHIEYVSNAQQSYNNACYNQVIGGIGYWRVVTDYLSPDSFDQEIYIRRIADPLSVYLDPNINEADGSDAEWGIIFKDIPNDEFERDYPDEADDLNQGAPLGAGSAEDSWTTRETTRVAEYFRKRYRKDRLHQMPNGTSVLESQVRKAERAAGEREDDEETLMDTLRAESIQSREVQVPTVEWFLLGGSKVLDRKLWPGSTIPIVRVIGEETVIDSVMDRKGHTRCLIDPQRIYNYWTSSAVEFVALQSKTPFVTAAEAIRGFETNWQRANVDNKAYLPYNAWDENGQKLEPPARAPVPTMSQAYLDGLRISASEMMMVSGQYEANMGMKSNEVSGKAVDARQRQGETSTYHFISRFADAIRYTGRILIDLIPKVYDTQRIVKIMAENGDQSQVHLDPSSPVAHRSLQDMDSRGFQIEQVQAVFNPNIGRYAVEADIGPAFATRRQETFAAISTILSENEQLTPVIGDLLFKAADFPMADEISQRLHNLVPAQALGTGPDPQLQKAQQIMAQQHQALQQLQTDNTKLQLKNASLEHEKMIKEYEAETNRMKAIGTIDPEAFKPVIRELVSQALNTPINPIIRAHAEEAASLPQPPEPQPAQPSPGASNGGA